MKFTSQRRFPKPYYPFGKDGDVKCEGCCKIYPLDGDDLQFEGQHPLFGIRACSNVFSGAEQICKERGLTHY